MTAGLTHPVPTPARAPHCEDRYAHGSPHVQPFAVEVHAMPRKKSPAPPPAQSAAALKRQIAELEQRLAETAAAERRRRGELMNEYLDGPHGERIRAALSDVVAPADRYLFFDDAGDSRQGA